MESPYPPHFISISFRRLFWFLFNVVPPLVHSLCHYMKLFYSFTCLLAPLLKCGKHGSRALSIFFTSVLHSPNVFIPQQIPVEWMNKWRVCRKSCNGRNVTNVISKEVTFDWMMTRNSDCGGQAVEKGAKCENAGERRHERSWKIESVQRYPDEKEETGLLSKEEISMVET